MTVLKIILLVYIACESCRAYQRYNNFKLDQKNSLWHNRFYGSASASWYRNNHYHGTTTTTTTSTTTTSRPSHHIRHSGYSSRYPKLDGVMHRLNPSQKMKPTTESSRSRLWNSYYQDPDYDEDDVIDSVGKEEDITDDEKWIQVNGRTFTVCKMAICGLHGIKKGRLRRLADSKSQCDVPPKDRRGQSIGSRSQKKPNILVELIKSHINSFPLRVSHYSRNESRRKYLSSDLSVKKMHLLYLEKYEPDAYAAVISGGGIRPKVKYEFYLHIFNTCFNLAFGKPRSDTCGKCEKAKIKIDSEEDPQVKNTLENELRLHHAKAEKFYTDLKAMTEIAKTDDTVEVICFDYQQNLPIPVLPVSEIFYKRQIWVFNQCFYSGKTGKSKMFMYDEIAGKKGANETISFLKYYIDNFIDPNVKTLYIFTDNCVGQNKNAALAQFLSLLASIHRFSAIYHRFPERGHSFLPCDRNFAQIEKHKRNVTYLYLPEEWYTLTQKVSTNFDVIRVTQDMIKDYRTYLQQFFKKSVRNRYGPFTITKYKCFKYVDNQILVSQAQTMESCNEAFQWLKSSLPNDILWNPKNLYEKPIPLNPLKLKNIQELEKYIPLALIRWYHNLEQTSSEAGAASNESMSESGSSESE